MKLYVGVTDNDWYRFLNQLPNVDEVNFWQPGGSHLFIKALRPGELFLFKLHSPQNFIAGGGFFTHASILPVSLAWEAFGEKNGAASFTEIRSKILQYRGSRTDPREDFEIGCILLQQPFFFAPKRMDFRPIGFSSQYCSTKKRTTWIRQPGKTSGT
jgi:putative restriction endonuclease